MREFSLEQAIEKIQQPKTRRYIDEVYSSYLHGNYRSAVVGLWSVVVCDMLFKLEELESVFGDKSAAGLLAEVRSKQAANPRSPDWEAHLLKQVSVKTELLEPAELLQLQQLQEQRHLAAHPVLSQSSELYSPTPDMVRAHLRSALEVLLTKPARFSRRVFNVLVEDLEAAKGTLLGSENALQEFLRTRYLEKMRPGVREQVFASLWSVTFRAEDERAVSNRDINHAALSVIFDRDPNLMRSAIERDAPRFSRISPAGDAVDRVIEFICFRPGIWEILAMDARSLIEARVQSSATGRTLGWFVRGGIPEHLKWLAQTLNEGNVALGRRAYALLVDLADAHDAHNEAHELGVMRYGQAGSFDTADRYFRIYIRPYVESWSLLTFEKFVETVNGNGETWGRRLATRDHAFVRRTFESRFSTEQFPKTGSPYADDSFGEASAPE